MVDAKPKYLDQSYPRYPQDDKEIQDIGSIYLEPGTSIYDLFALGIIAHTGRHFT